MEKNTGKKFVTQGKLGENTGNLISAGMWPPCITLAVEVLRTTEITDQMHLQRHALLNF